VGKLLKRSEEGVREKEEWVGRKGITCSQSQTFYQTDLAQEREAKVQFDCLVDSQSKSDKNLHSAKIRQPEHDNIKI